METESPTRPQGDAAHQELLHLAGIAPLGVLDPEAGRRLDRHLRGGCGRCEGALELAWQDIDVLALTTPRVEPSPEARDRLLAAVDAKVTPLRPRARLTAVPWLAAAALAALAVGLGAVGQRELANERAARVEAERKIAEEQSARADVESELAEMSAAKAALARRTAELEGAVDVVAGPATEAVDLSGESAFDEARVRVLYDPSLKRTVLLARELPPPPPGETYQLWRIEDGVPSSLGVFQPDDLGSVLELDLSPLDAQKLHFFAVSVEPEGGVPQPTGPIVLTGG